MQQARHANIRINIKGLWFAAVENV